MPALCGWRCQYCDRILLSADSIALCSISCLLPCQRPGWISLWGLLQVMMCVWEAVGTTSENAFGMPPNIFPGSASGLMSERELQ